MHTHAHLDHIGGTAELCEHTHADSYLHPDDQMLHNLLPQQAMLLGLPLPKYGPIDEMLSDGQGLSFGKFELGTLHTLDTHRVRFVLLSQGKTSASLVILCFEIVSVEPISGVAIQMSSRSRFKISSTIFRMQSKW